ncbi:1-acyl-sn-glycerol-3-phosphate acyltransferase [Brevundimonas sp. LM2]|uniref:lysophospholipid acyltransferase family protein n=1 Tax=Brevundimonas sp. LM2 TaxID=1938605 RepID=UPI000983B1F2|nr:lysophospholipid acyltransferase family protein [Brevundimonas sp. LM2]AQR60864.1 1-acyl-sn-glycerol-3-phosphate acyltransferase [Brevundimonas sp. LM2]
MITLRSLVFVAWLYLSLVLFAVVLSPALLLPHRHALWVARSWARCVLFGLRWITGIKVEFRGLEHRPSGRALLACKHQAMLDTIVPFVVLEDPCIITKKELMGVPFFGWFASKTKMISVDRSAGSAALRDMVKQSRARSAEGRQIWIFPEGTRAAINTVPDYKPGVMAMYRDLELPCTPVATNAGAHWPAHGLRRYPGTIVYEFLPPIEANLKRQDFMAELERRIETASTALLPVG